MGGGDKFLPPQFISPLPPPNFQKFKQRLKVIVPMIFQLYFVSEDASSLLSTHTTNEFL